MAEIQILLSVEEGDPSADPEHDTGLTTAAYERLTGDTEHGPGALAWLGEVSDVRQIRGEA